MTDIAVTHDARARAERIRVGIHSFIATRKEIADAYRDRDWSTLGYESWEQYVDGEFSETRVRLTADERREAVAELRFAGMSQRAIASTLGVDQATVSRDLRGDANASPAEITGTDGKSYASTKPAREVPDEVRQAVKDVTPEPTDAQHADLLAEIPSILADGPLTLTEIRWRCGGPDSSVVELALRELEESGQVDPAGRAVRGNHMEDLWALAEDVTPQDLPASPGEGRSAGLTSAIRSADESAGSVVDPDAADELPAATCEACGGEIDEGEAGIGYRRCDGCDSDGNHVARELDEGGWGTCRACHPEPDEPVLLTGGQDYLSDPVERIASVAQVAPEFVRPAEPDPVAMVAAALDQFVPDPNAGTFAWRKDLHAKLKPAHHLTLWIDVDDAAEFASADDVETIRHLANSFADLHRRIMAARNGNVVQLRAVQ